MRDQHDPRVRLHFIIEGADEVFLRENVAHVPRVGDELRFEGDKFFRVTRVIWVYDEGSNWWDCARANIGMEIIEDA